MIKCFQSYTYNVKNCIFFLKLKYFQFMYKIGYHYHTEVLHKNLTRICPLLSEKKLIECFQPYTSNVNKNLIYS